MRLVEAKTTGPRPFHEGGRLPFSLIFRADDARHLPQRIYPIDHERLGTLEIFLVPLGPADGGMRYQAVFT